MSKSIIFIDIWRFFLVTLVGKCRVAVYSENDDLRDGIETVTEATSFAVIVSTTFDGRILRHLRTK